jgi:hypothetical protein
VSSFAEVFPHDDPVARFIVAISMARNDVRHALTQALRAGDRDSPEFTYWIRLAMAHFFEADLALREWRKIPEVQRFIAKLPEDAQEALRKASSAIQRMGPGILEHSRHRTFHYPYPTSRYPSDEELTTALRALGGDEPRVAKSEDESFLRLHFADDVALALAVAKYDRASLRTQSEITRDGAVGFVNFALRAWEAYCDTRGLEIGMPASSG